MALRPLSAREIIRQGLPDLRCDEEHRTKHESTQRLWFLASLSEWNIEQEARQCSESINWKDDIQGYEFEKERLECGDEHSILARFNQNLCHTLTPILHEYIQEGIRFADFKCAKCEVGFTKIPDVVLISKEHNLYLVGEAKTPWAHNIEKKQEKIGSFRRFIGQIASYMHKTNCKYGWLTTYDQTMFFQQVPHPEKKDAWILRHSPIINHDAKYEEVTEEKSKDPTQYRRKVTLAECFLYLAKRACEDGKAINPMKAFHWVGTDSTKIDLDDDDYISVDDEDHASSSQQTTCSED